MRLLPYTWQPVRTGLPLVGWVCAYAAISQIGVVVVLRVAFDHAGVSIYTYSDLIFMVPFGILSVSLMTIFMPRIAQAVAKSDTPGLLDDLGRATRYTIVVLVPIVAAMTVLGPSMAKVVFVGRVDLAAAQLIGITVASSAFGLIPLSVVMLQMRVFYAGNDARTPVVINIVMVAAKAGTILISTMMLPSQGVVVMLGVGSSLSYLVGAVTGHFLLRRRNGLLGFRRVFSTLSRVSAASAVGGLVAVAAVAVSGAAVAEPRLAAGAALVVGTALGGAMFLLSLKLIGVPELRIILHRLSGLLPR